jgi:drug/metabolite transporter (DMT)-like permease
VWVSLAFHSLVVSFASFLVWFWLLRKYLASRLGVFSFMTPLFGIVFGAWLLSEPIELSFLLGAVPVLAGIVLVSGGGWVTQTLKGLRK